MKSNKVVNTLFLFFVSLSVLFISGCNNEEKEQEEKALQANETIIYYNELLVVIENAQDPMNQINTEMELSEKFTEKQLQNYKPLWQRVSVAIRFRVVEDTELTAPLFFEQEMQDSLNNGILTLKEDTARLKDLIKQIELYFRAEDYKDDNFAMSGEILSEMQVLINEIYSVSNSCIELVQPLADEAERKTLENDPVGIYILNMRDVLALAEQEYMIFDNKAFLSKNDPGQAALLEQIDEIRNLISGKVNVVRNVDTSELPENAVKSYNLFFEKYDAFDGIVRKSLREIDDTGKLIRPDRIMDGYINMMEKHNSFIDDINS